MEKVRALFLCDEQLGERTKRIADERGDVEIALKPITHLDIDKLTQEIDQNNYEVFISRGESSIILAEQFDLPVIDIPVSEYDMLKILRTLNAYPGKKALIFYYTMLGDMSALCELMQYQIDLFKIHSTQEGKEILKRLREENYSLIVGGYTVIKAAKQLGMNGIVIQSGDASINQCLDRAVSVAKQVRKLSGRASVYEAVIAHSGQHTVVFRENGKRLYNSIPNQHPHYDYIMDIISSLMQYAVLNKEAVFYREQTDSRWVFQSKQLQDDRGQRCIAFYVRSIPKEPGMLDDVISIRGTGEYIEPFLNPFDGISKRIQTLMQEVQLYGKSDCSVLVVGNDGTGKGLLSEMLHMYSQYSNDILVKFYCELLDCEQLDLIFGEQSIFNLADRGTLILSNVHALSIECQKKLYQHLSGDGRMKNFRLIATTRYDLSEKVEKNAFVYKLYKKISELQILMPTLRERAEDIEGLVSILIGTFNQELATDVIGFEKKALDLLKDFGWEHDIDQLKRVVRTLMLESSGPYITVEDTQRILHTEKSKVIAQGAISKKVDFSGTLDEIMNSVVKAIVEEEGMNQSRAAKRLGISRSTMWRRLK